MKVAELENQLKNYISIEENLQSVIVAQKESLQAEEILKQDLRSKITVSYLSYSFKRSLINNHFRILNPNCQQLYLLLSAIQALKRYRMI